MIYGYGPEVFIEATCLNTECGIDIGEQGVITSEEGDSWCPACGSDELKFHPSP